MFATKSSSAFEEFGEDHFQKGDSGSFVHLKCSSTVILYMFCFYKWADTSLHIRLLKALSIFSEFQCTITFLQSYIFIFSILMSRKYQCLPDFNEILFSRAPSYSTTIFSAIMSWYLNWTAVSPPQFRTRVCVEDRNKKMFPSFSINAWNAAVVITSQPQS